MSMDRTETHGKCGEGCCIHDSLRDDAPIEQYLIANKGIDVTRMLLRKNRQYGSSATAPIRVFSKLEAIEGIKLRMDDKLSRIRNGAADDDEDPIYDLAGYCILYLVAQAQETLEVERNG